jgi:hypothetical protein
VWLSRSGAEAAPPLEAEWRLWAGQGRAGRGASEETKRAAPASFLGIVATLAWLLGWAELRASSEPLSIRLNLDGSDSVTRVPSPISATLCRYCRCSPLTSLTSLTWRAIPDILSQT